MAKIEAVAGNFSEIQSTEAKRRLLIPQHAQRFDLLEHEVVPIKTVGFAPQCFAHRFVGSEVGIPILVNGPSQPLFCPVVDCWYSLQTEQNRNTQGHLILRCEWVVESFRLIVVIEERDKIFSSLAVGTNKSLFGDFAMLKNLPNRFHAVVAGGFDDPGQLEKERKIKGGVDAETIGVGAVSADELGDRVFVVVDFAECEKVSFADRLSEFANGVPEHLNVMGRYMLDRINAETINVELRDDELVGEDQDA